MFDENIENTTGRVLDGEVSYNFTMYVVGIAGILIVWVFCWRLQRRMPGKDRYSCWLFVDMIEVIINVMMITNDDYVLKVYLLLFIILYSLSSYSIIIY